MIQKQKKNFYSRLAQWPLSLLLALSIVSIQSYAQSSGSFNLSERAKKREGSRWTLAEWLAQKDRNRMMDMWLAMNSSSPFEFSLLGTHTNYKKTVSSGTNEYTVPSLEVSAYAKIFGLTLDYEKRDSERENDLNGLFNFRLFGDSLQSSSLTLHYGQRTRTFSGLTPASILRNQFAQVSLQIYLSRYFGLNGYYRQFQPFPDANFGDVTGYQQQAGVFIDFQFIRIFGYWFEEIQKNSNPSPNAMDLEGVIRTDIKRNGIKTGLQLFF
ncbi:MAG: hypothetical protein JNL11_05300 [Bdellovibrionaceae bacterium]|nr:hypothetical protein [Pseudobdellovibrionaceae bacterium]